MLAASVVRQQHRSLKIYSAHGASLCLLYVFFIVSIFCAPLARVFLSLLVHAATRNTEHHRTPLLPPEPDEETTAVVYVPCCTPGISLPIFAAGLMAAFPRRVAPLVPSSFILTP